MRLINADVLIEKIVNTPCKCLDNYSDGNAQNGIRYGCASRQNEIIDIINEQPTAYDVDKVVEQLEEERECSYADFTKYVSNYSPCLDDEYDDFFHRGLERAIKVVKAGVRNER